MKKVALITSICISFAIILSIVVFAFTQNQPHSEKKVKLKKQQVYNIYEQQPTKNDYRFPVNDPQFIAKIQSVSSPTLEQQAITIYSIDEKNKTPIFERHYYDDGFHGNTLSYTIASNTAAFSQKGSFGRIGCKQDVCNIMWNNFYVWDAKQQTFILENNTHKETFTDLLALYQTIDKIGCNDGLSFTKMYQQSPKRSFYCEDNQNKVKNTELVFFLKAKKALEKIRAGENLGSREIRKVSLF